MKTKWSVFVVLALALALLQRTALAQDGCPPEYYYSRETIACEQEVCPEGTGRNYTLECICPEGSGLAQQFETREDPTWGTYNVVVGCYDPTQAGADQTGGTGTASTGILGWWNGMSTSSKVAVVGLAVGGTVFLGASFVAMFGARRAIAAWLAARAALAAARSAVVSAAEAFGTAYATGDLAALGTTPMARRLLLEAITRVQNAVTAVLRLTGQSTAAAAVRVSMLAAINRWRVAQNFPEISLNQFEILLETLGILTR